MLPLDPSTYLAATLKPYATGVKPGLPGLFERYLLEATDNDEVTIAKRMRDVKAIWDKSLEHSRYGELAKTLAGEHDDAGLSLLDDTERARLAGQARQAAADASRKSASELAEWRSLLAEYVQQGGLTPNSRATLERLAKTLALDPAMIAVELDGAPVAAEPDVMEKKVRDQVRKSLQELARVVDEQRLALSLYHALGLEGITEKLAEVQRQYDAVDLQNRGRGYGQTATAYKTLLANVKLHLLDSDPRAYIEGLILDVGDTMEFEAARAATDNVIDPIEAESLIQRAMSLGLTAELGRRLVSELARKNDAIVETGAVVDYVACPACNTPHPRPSAPDACRRCGVALFIACPADGCGTRNDATALRCSQCQTDLHRYAEATRRLAALPDAVAEGRVGWAAAELQEIARVLGASAIAPELRERLQARERDAERAWAEVEAALADRRLYAARSTLRDLTRTAKDVLGPTGDRPATRAQEVDRRIGEVDAVLARARSATGAAREAALVDAVDLAADCDEAVAALAAIPPEPPGPVQVALGPGGPVLSWGPSATGGARYRVRRIDAHTGASAELPPGAAPRCEDRDAPSGAVVQYEVVTIRGTAVSSPVQSAALLVAREVRDLVVADADGEVRLSWQAVPASARAIVHRTDERTGAVTDLLADRTGLVDRAVENGTRYEYRVVVEYRGVGGAAQQTRGATVYGQPAAPPEGIEHLRIASGPGGVTIAFERPPSGTVTVVRCADEPATSPGEAIDPGRLGQLGVVLSVSADGAHDDDPVGVCWYLPVTVAGGTAIIGRATRYLALPEIANVTAVETPGQVRVTWEWPADVRIAKVLWRRDRQPAGADEPGTDSAWVRLGEYRDNGGFTIATDGPGSAFVAVVPALRTDGELVAGTSIPKGARAAVRSAVKADLRYVVRSVGRMRKKRLEVEVHAPSGVAAPSMVLVVRDGDLLPRTAGEGEMLARLGGDAPLSSVVDISGRSRPLAVRLFLESASSATSFRLFDPSADDLLIR